MNREKKTSMSVCENLEQFLSTDDGGNGPNCFGNVKRYLASCNETNDTNNFNNYCIIANQATNLHTLCNNINDAATDQKNILSVMNRQPIINWNIPKIPAPSIHMHTLTYPSEPPPNPLSNHLQIGYQRMIWFQVHRNIDGVERIFLQNFRYVQLFDKTITVILPTPPLTNYMFALINTLNDDVMLVSHSEVSVLKVDSLTYDSFPATTVGDLVNFTSAGAWIVAQAKTSEQIYFFNYNSTVPQWHPSLITVRETFLLRVTTDGWIVAFEQTTGRFHFQGSISAASPIKTLPNFKNFLSMSNVIARKFNTLFFYVTFNDQSSNQQTYRITWVNGEDVFFADYMTSFLNDSPTIIEPMIPFVDKDFLFVSTKDHAVHSVIGGQQSIIDSKLSTPTVTPHENQSAIIHKHFTHDNDITTQFVFGGVDTWSYFFNRAQDKPILFLDNGNLTAMDGPLTIAFESSTTDEFRSSQADIESGKFVTLVDGQTQLTPNGQYLFHYDRDHTSFMQFNPINGKNYLEYCQEHAPDQCEGSIISYCRAHKEADPRCYCWDNTDEILASIFNIEQLKRNQAMYQQLRAIAPCLTNQCNPEYVRETDTVIGSLLNSRYDGCSASIEICTNIIDVQGNLSGEIVKASCGSDTPCQNTCPVGQACDLQTNFCSTVCSSNDDCPGGQHCGPSGACTVGTTQNNKNKTTTITIVIIVIVVLIVVGVVLYFALRNAF